MLYPATIRTEWVNVKEFCGFYRLTRSLVKRLINQQVLTAIKFGNTYRIFNPGYAAMLVSHDISQAMEHMYLIPHTVAASLLGMGVCDLVKWRDQGFIRGQKFECLGARGSPEKWFYQLVEVRRALIVKPCMAFHRKKKYRKKEFRLAPPIRRWATEQLRKRTYDEVMRMPIPKALLNPRDCNCPLSSEVQPDLLPHPSRGASSPQS